MTSIGKVLSTILMENPHQIDRFAGLMHHESWHPCHTLPFRQFEGSFVNLREVFLEAWLRHQNLKYNRDFLFLDTFIGIIEHSTIEISKSKSRYLE